MPVCCDSQPHDVITHALPTFKEPAGVNPTEGNRVMTSEPRDRVQRVEQRNMAIPGNVNINMRAMEGVEVDIRVPRGYLKAKNSLKAKDTKKILNSFW